MAKIKTVLDAVLKYSPMRAKLAPDDLVDGDTVKITCSKGTVAMVRCWETEKVPGKNHVEDAERDILARLLAAAPEMLISLIELTRVIESDKEPGDIDFVRAALMAKLAIISATGCKFMFGDNDSED